MICSAVRRWVRCNTSSSLPHHLRYNLVVGALQDLVLHQTCAPERVPVALVPVRPTSQPQTTRTTTGRH